jgi:SAM-dependent methyltransferase
MNKKLKINFRVAVFHTVRFFIKLYRFFILLCISKRVNRITNNSEYCFLKDQDPLTEEEYEIAKNVCQHIRHMLSIRNDFIHKKRMDPEIHMPRANWSADKGFNKLTERILSSDKMIINHLRLFSQIFTGYSLVWQYKKEGIPLLNDVPKDLDSDILKRRNPKQKEILLYCDALKKLPEELCLSLPNKFGEIGYLINGKIVNFDAYVYLERVVLMYEANIINELIQLEKAGKTPVILEIGAGYGGLAYFLKKLLPRSRYIIVDIPESLVFSAIYLSILFKDQKNVLFENTASDLTCEGPGFTFLSNYLFDEILKSGIKFDLVINTLSMSEMSENQIRYYCEGIRSRLKDNGVFFEQNQDNRHIGFQNAQNIIREYFPWHMRIFSNILLLITQGTPNIWSINSYKKRYHYNPKLIFKIRNIILNSIF